MSGGALRAGSANPHPALRATFSRREKGCYRHINHQISAAEQAFLLTYYV
jgi:hypothetical protein